MKRIVKIALVLMTIVTVIYGMYVGAVVYGSSHPNSNDLLIVTAAFEFKGQPPSPPWLTPEELGIVEIAEHRGWLDLLVPREKCYQLQAERPIFLYKDKFYKVDGWVTGDSSGEGATHGLQILLSGGLGAGLATGWIIFGAVYRRERKTMMRRMTDNWMSEK